ncbi:hypothetical protein ACN9MZ_27825 [Pseudoduganella sp. S-14]|jgi:hypothetical protein|uniref:hypothetical protein n=1 Tax=Pseudoduganella sp. S-14 TaxID=3404065 RepID=UPI003CEC09DA
MAFEVITLATCAAVWKLHKELPEIFAGRKKSLREEAEFADKFLKRVNDADLSAFALERGYQALAGSRAVRAKGVKHLLSLTDDPGLLHDYVDGVSHIELKEDAGLTRFHYKEKAKTRRQRNWLKFQCNAMYAVFFLFGLSPLIMVWFRKDFEPLLYLLVSVPVFVPLAILCAADGLKVESAERVMAVQEAAKPMADRDLDATATIQEIRP